MTSGQFININSLKLLSAHYMPRTLLGSKDEKGKTDFTLKE